MVGLTWQSHPIQSPDGIVILAGGKQANLVDTGYQPGELVHW